jgi:hypothetical protein
MKSIIVDTVAASFASLMFAMVGGLYPKPTSLWHKGIVFKGKVCNAQIMKDEPHQHGNMRDNEKDKNKRSLLPKLLCLAIVDSMLAQNPHMSVCWVLSLYEGVGSFSKATAERPNVWSIQISNNHQTGIDNQRRIVKINYHLNQHTTLQQLYKIVWHVTGFTPATLIGVTCSPPCNTTTRMKNAHRSSKAEGYVAQSPLAKKHDLVFAHWFKELFQ